MPHLPSPHPASLSLPVFDGRNDALPEFVRELQERVAGDIRFGHHDRMLYATDASLYQVEPMGVVIPASIEDAAKAVAVCAAHGVPMLPRGGGTSLAGQCTNRAVVIDLSRHCCAVRSIDTEQGRCVVEPGITIDDLNAQLAPTGWFFAPDPATSRHACIGGCIGNNAAGARSIRYGRTSENVLGIEVCLADGLRVRLGAWKGPAPELGAKKGPAPKHGAKKGPAPDTKNFAQHLSSRAAAIVQQHACLIRDRFPKTLRRNAGYNLDMLLTQLEAGTTPEALDLTPLLCGSEGTLAFTLLAELKLHRIPAARGLAVVAFASVDEAIEAVLPILETRPTAVELLDDKVIALARANREYRRIAERLPQVEGGQTRAVLYVEYTAERETAELETGFASLRQIVKSSTITTYTEANAMLRAWALRKAGEPLLHGIAGDRKPITFVEDNAVPVERLGEFVRRFRAIVKKHGTEAAFFAHASVGVLHVRPLLDLHEPADRERMHAIAVEVADLAKELGGVPSGEHGDGKVRSPLLERFYGPELMRAFREVKTLFDPENRMNPGNIVEPIGVEPTPHPIESISQRTRIDPGNQQRSIPRVWTYFNFTDEHGLSGAVEMCNGAGVCRKKSGGTMCPSYQATLDERHSTRGRGNALRLAITGQLDSETSPVCHGSVSRAPLLPSLLGSQSSKPSHHSIRTADTAVAHRTMWNDPETRKTLDLCLSCKACKSECPSNVDIAKLKAEYLAQGYRERGRAPIGVRLMGSVRSLNKIGSLAPGAANAAVRSSFGKKLAATLLGIDPRRTLPAFERSLTKQVDRRVARRPADLPTGQSAVVLFGDCFTMYNEPGIGLAAVRLLRAFGYAVGLADAGCCGRAMISQGLLTQASRRIPHTAERLMPWVRDRRVRAVLVLEPSCLSALTDDWLDLRSATPRSDLLAIAKHATTVEAFLDSHWESHPTQPSGTHRWHGSPSRESEPHGSESRATKIIYHGHCHAKALWGIESQTAILQRFTEATRLGEPCHHGDRLTILDSGCCGMAGAFGYARTRYDLSMRIGEQTLLPAVRACDEETVVLAPGTSCRHQITEGTGCRAMHPVEWLASMAGEYTAPGAGSFRPRLMDNIS